MEAPGSRYCCILAAHLLHIELCGACVAVSGCSGFYYTQRRVLQGVYGVVASQGLRLPFRPDTSLLILFFGYGLSREQDMAPL